MFPTFVFIFSIIYRYAGNLKTLTRIIRKPDLIFPVTLENYARFVRITKRFLTISRIRNDNLVTEEIKQGLILLNRIETSRIKFVSLLIYLQITLNALI